MTQSDNSGFWQKWKCYYGTNSWIRISMMLCLFGFFKEFRPSDPFIYDFVIGPWRNLTEEQVSSESLPLGTYSYLATLIIIFLIIDICRYKPIIIVMALLGIGATCVLLWTTSLLWVQLFEVIYGPFLAAEIAYYTYIYAKVEKEHYQVVSSHSRAALLAGRSLSGFAGQFLVSFDILDYKQLNYITLGSLVCALVWAPFLPPVKRTIYFHQETNINDNASSSKCEKAFILMKTHFLDSFSQNYVLKWSIWWSLTTAGFIQIQSMVQPLWIEIKDECEVSVSYNGVVEAVATILGFLGALVAGYLKVDWKRKGELILSICTLCTASLTITASQAGSVFVGYVCYSCLVSVHHFMMTIASSEIAKHIIEDSYGFVFSVNTFIALIIQTGLMLVFVDKVGFALNSRNQYLAYGIYEFGIASIFVIMVIRNWIKDKGR